MDTTLALEMALEALAALHDRGGAIGDRADVVARFRRLADELERQAGLPYLKAIGRVTGNHDLTYILVRGE